MVQIQLDGWNPRAPLFFQPHGSFTGGTKTCCLFHPWVDNDLHAFTASSACARYIPALRRYLRPSGNTSGRPPKFDTEQLDHAMTLLEDHSYTQVVKLTGISKSTLIREKKRRQA